MKVRFVPQDVEFEISPDETVFDVAIKNGIYIKTVCNGVPSCAECRVRVIEGEHNVLPPSQKEKILIGTAHFIDQRRLSCQLHCFGDITVDLSEQNEKKKTEGIKKRLKSGVVIDESKSHAKSGNLIDQDEDLRKEIDKEVGDDFDNEDGSDRSAIEQLKAETTEDDLRPQSRNRGRHKSSRDRNHRNRNNKDRSNRDRNKKDGDRSRGKARHPQKDARDGSRSDKRDGDSQNSSRSSESRQRDDKGGRSSGGKNKGRNRHRNRHKSKGPQGGDK